MRYILREWNNNMGYGAAEGRDVIHDGGYIILPKLQIITNLRKLKTLILVM